MIVHRQSYGGCFSINFFRPTIPPHRLSPATTLPWRKQIQDEWYYFLVPRREKSLFRHISDEQSWDFHSRKKGIIIAPGLPIMVPSLKKRLNFCRHSGNTIFVPIKIFQSNLDESKILPTQNCRYPTGNRSFAVFVETVDCAPNATVL